jgi:hypothetical protein
MSGPRIICKGIEVDTSHLTDDASSNDERSRAPKEDGQFVPDGIKNRELILEYAERELQVLACVERAAMMRMPSFWHMRPNCVTGASPRNCSPGVAFRCYTFFQSV